MRLQFDSENHLAKWLHQHPFGKRVLADALADAVEDKCRGCEYAASRSRVLVVLYSDGWVEAYAERSTLVKVVTKIDAPTPEAGQLAERYLDLALPRVYADLYWPVKRCAVGLCETLTAERVSYFRELRKCCDELRRIPT